MSKKIITILKREYLTRIRTRAFIFSTFFFPVLLLIIFAGVQIFEKFFESSTKYYTVIDHSGKIFSELSVNLSDTLGTGKPKYSLTERSVDQSEENAVLEELKAEVLNKNIDGYIIIPENIIRQRRIYYSARSLGNIIEQSEISRAVSTIVTNYRLIEKGFSPNEVQVEMQAGRIELESIQVTESGARERSSGSSNAIARAFIFIMYFVLLIYGQMLLNSIIEDKSTRVSETVLSSVSSFQLLSGKLLGICLLGFTQLVIYGTLFILGIFFSESFIPASSEVMDIIEQIRVSPVVLVYLLVYFIMGFIFYASIYGIIGAMVNTEDEGKQLQMPVTVFVVIAFFISLISVENPETNQAYIASLIPFFTPIIMIARIAALDPMIPEGTLLSILILFVSTVGTVILSSRIFRVGILMYGKKATFREVIKWLHIK